MILGHPILRSYGVDLTDGLLAYYPFNGNANDESGNGYNGTVTGASLTTDRNSNANSAYLFSSGSTFITLPIALGNIIKVNPFSVSCWIKCNDTAKSLQVIITLTDDNSFGDVNSVFEFNINHFASPWGVEWYVGGGGEYINTTITTNWTHLVGTFDGTDASFYVDNILIDTNSISTDPSIRNPTKFLIGSNASRYFTGTIDDIRIYNRVISTDEITALYNE